MSKSKGWSIHEQWCSLFHPGGGSATQKRIQAGTGGGREMRQGIEEVRRTGRAKLVGTPRTSRNPDGMEYELTRDRHGNVVATPTDGGKSGLGKLIY